MRLSCLHSPSIHLHFCIFFHLFFCFLYLLGDFFKLIFGFFNCNFKNTILYAKISFYQLYIYIYFGAYLSLF